LPSADSKTRADRWLTDTFLLLSAAKYMTQEVVGGRLTELTVFVTPFYMKKEESNSNLRILHWFIYLHAISRQV
jgi:hypothetical protein